MSNIKNIWTQKIGEEISKKSKIRVVPHGNSFDPVKIYTHTKDFAGAVLWIFISGLKEIEKTGGIHLSLYFELENGEGRYRVTYGINKILSSLRKNIENIGGARIIKRYPESVNLIYNIGEENNILTDFLNLLGFK